VTRDHVIICRGYADGRPCLAEGCYLYRFDPEFAEIGLVEWTRKLDEAMPVDRLEAVQMFRTVSTTRPVRDDGEPNRPLTAFNIEISPRKLVEEEDSHG